MLLGLGQVVGYHFCTHFLRGDLGHPTQFLLGFGGVAEQGCDLSRAEVAGSIFTMGLSFQ